MARTTVFSEAVTEAVLSPGSPRTLIFRSLVEPPCLREKQVLLESGARLVWELPAALGSVNQPGERVIWPEKVSAFFPAQALVISFWPVIFSFLICSTPPSFSCQSWA